MNKELSRRIDEINDTDVSNLLCTILNEIILYFSLAVEFATLSRAARISRGEKGKIARNNGGIYIHI